MSKSRVWFGGLRTLMFLTTQTKALCLWDCWVATMSFFDSEASCCVTVLNKSAAHTRLLLQVIVQTNWTKETYLEGRVTVWKVVSIVRVYKSHPAVGTVLFPPFFPSISLVEPFFCVWGRSMFEVVFLLWHTSEKLDAPSVYPLMYIVNQAAPWCTSFQFSSPT